MSDPFDQQKTIPGVNKIIAISSGKGGVGKSTISAHLALTLGKKGKKVGLLDADIYGPSVPRIMGTMNQKPMVIESRIQTLDVGGIKTMSIGNLVEEDLAIVWRGPMLFKAMNQFLFEVDWGQLDYLLIDLPPGTGDVQLSLAQKVPIDGAVSITTPQNIALADVKKSIDMFKRVNVPILGVIENMAFLLNANGEKIQIFPKGELEDYLQKNDIKKIAEIPLDPEIGKNCEIGLPLSYRETSPSFDIFSTAVDRIVQLIENK